VRVAVPVLKGWELSCDATLFFHRTIYKEFVVVFTLIVVVVQESEEVRRFSELFHKVEIAFGVGTYELIQLVVLFVVESPLLPLLLDGRRGSSTLGISAVEEIVILEQF
jgi:hypothetical protein